MRDAWGIVAEAHHICVATVRAAMADIPVCCCAAHKGYENVSWTELIKGHPCYTPGKVSRALLHHFRVASAKGVGTAILRCVADSCTWQALLLTVRMRTCAAARLCRPPAGFLTTMPPACWASSQAENHLLQATLTLMTLALSPNKHACAGPCCPLAQVPAPLPVVALLGGTPTAA